MAVLPPQAEGRSDLPPLAGEVARSAEGGKRSVFAKFEEISPLVFPLSAINTERIYRCLSPINGREFFIFNSVVNPRPLAGEGQKLTSLRSQFQGEGKI
ncbi:hypothetical protein B0187_06355 [Haemophilus paracuniculus]|uniref:Uncharacterized protein n=1 Tax=Haemophilus paracuniculus TaxID=734 RepID=A0A1T0ASH8_9PAST|nr:hypothetical protein B0187_06355 [Haemophilus paracuniculus]